MLISSGKNIIEIDIKKSENINRNDYLSFKSASNMNLIIIFHNS